MNRPGTGFKQSIQLKIGITIIVLTTLILSGFGIYQYLALQSNAIMSLNNSAERTIERLAETLIKPLWDLDEEQIEKVLLSEMREKNIFAVLVKDRKKSILYGKQRNTEWQIVDTTREISGDFITKRKEVVGHDKKLGIVELYLTQKFMKAELRQAISTIVVTVIVLDVALLIVLTISLRRLLIYPIYRILKIANGIAGCRSCVEKY